MSSDPSAPFGSNAWRLAPAKVNLGLAVTGRRTDGYHELRSVFLRLGLADRLSGVAGARLADDRLVVVGDETCPVDGNIVTRSIELVRREHQFGAGPERSLDLLLEKRIPMAAGLGGGSSDAAATISLAAELWRLELTHAKAVELGAQLGADVPFFAEQHPTALVTGIGDRMEPLPAPTGGTGVLLVTPAERLFTAAVFAEFDRQPLGQDSGRVVDELAATMQAGLDAASLANCAPRLRDANDLWPAAVRLLPSLERLRSELERLLDRAFLLSGSGSTLFALYPSPDQAQEAGRTLSALAPSEIGGATVIATGTAIERDAWRIQ